MSHGLGFFNAIFTTAIVVIILVWGVVALTNGDPIWFISSFTAQAQELTIYWEGDVFTLTASDPGYKEIMNAFAKCVAKPIAYEEQVGFSEENIKQYKDNFKLLEVSFAQPIQVHTRYPVTKARTYLIPLDKTHALARRIFAFPGYLPYTSGPVNVKPTAFEGLYAAVEKVAAVQ